MRIQEYFDKIMNKEEEFDRLAKYLEEEGCFKEKMSMEKFFILYGSLLSYIIINKIDYFRMDDYYDVYFPKEWILEEPLDDYMEMFDLIEEYYAMVKREFEPFVLHNWKYKIFYDGFSFNCERICGQGEVLRRIEVVNG